LVQSLSTSKGILAYLEHTNKSLVTAIIVPLSKPGKQLGQYLYHRIVTARI
jgi:hypothetical protein